MALLDIVCNVVNIGEGTMEVPVVHIIDNTAHPRTIVFFPVLAPLQILHECLVSFVEV